ncbi:ABC transporter permease [Syntrophomonas palmitatica]|uniref:ABC transporter permease n=1 Tax=Syntrophomonas palmitatica TaxID=402877 RepID=UPI0006D04F42|nr:ABC transporter permease subunit [Syntrophomonas palmitatica]
MKHIFRLTIKEIASKRLFYLGLVFTLMYLGLIALGEYYAARDMSQGPVSSMMVTVCYQFMCLGWYISTLMIGTLCIALASGSLSREIESGTILGLASRPLGRGSILIGKFTAYLSVMVLYSVILLLAISLISSYYFKMPLETLSMIKGIGIFIMYPMVLLALTFFLFGQLEYYGGRGNMFYAPHRGHYRRLYRAGGCNYAE